MHRMITWTLESNSGNLEIIEIKTDVLNEPAGPKGKKYK